MSYQLSLADVSKKPVFENLMQFYLYDFSEFNNAAVNVKGLFDPYAYLDKYWVEEGRFPYLIVHNGEFAGFALVRFDLSENVYSIAEFFILKKFRRNSLGTTAAHDLFRLHPGKWEVTQIERNVPARRFWEKTISMFADGEYTNISSDGLQIQTFFSGNKEGVL
ncbi:GNAT family N-acetyltransferase [Metabacillus indicus]|uniref:GNAT family N-acetyltransferase n=1 Tax=Metabacillus indicus TaxID=246786 RepID=UPI0024920262|nr:GNAT family N-acetyltransferase [Metabacillus indicus]